jgi:hypothetical protein
MDATRTRPEARNKEMPANLNALVESRFHDFLFFQTKPLR